MDDRGQTLPLLALAVALGCMCVAGVARFGADAVAEAEARTAADAAALAAAGAGPGSGSGAGGGRLGTAAAEGVARRNGARVVAVEAVGEGDVRVTVEHVASGARAVARARAVRVERAWPPGMAPALRAVVARAEQLLGRRLPVRRARGLVLEVPDGAVAAAVRVGPDAGLCQVDPGADPRLFEVCPARIGPGGGG